MEFELQDIGGQEANNPQGLEVVDDGFWFLGRGRQFLNIYKKWAQEFIVSMRGGLDDEEIGWNSEENAGIAAKFWAKINGWKRAGCDLIRPSAFLDLVDKINTYYLPMLLLLVAMDILILATLNPVDCLHDARLNMTENEFNYVLTVCRTKNFYKAIPNSGVSLTSDEPGRQVFGYFHWISIILVVQSVILCLPYWIWTSLNNSNDIEFAKIVRLSGELLVGRQKDIEQKFIKIAHMIHLATKQHERHPFGGGAFACILYIALKCVCLMNVVAQFICWNMMIGDGNIFWGYDMLSALISGEIWKGQSVFPVLTVCEVDLHRLGEGIQHFELQCFLPINDTLEKTCMFLWWLFLVIACVTALNIVYHCLFFNAAKIRENTAANFVIDFLPRIQLLDPREEQKDLTMNLFGIFCLNYDGVLLFQFISDKGGSATAGHLMAALFEAFLADNGALLNQYDNSVPSSGENDDE